MLDTLQTLVELDPETVDILSKPNAATERTEDYFQTGHGLVIPADLIGARGTSGTAGGDALCHSLPVADALARAAVGELDWLEKWTV